MMQAAAASVIALLDPAVGRPASAPVASAMAFPAQCWSSGMCTKHLEASSIALKTSGGEMEPPMRVKVPAALTTRLMPYFSYGLYITVIRIITPCF